MLDWQSLIALRLLGPITPAVPLVSIPLEVKRSCKQARSSFVRPNLSGGNRAVP